MEVKINKEIRNYTESMFFGLSLRQFIFSVLACGVAVGFALVPFVHDKNLLAMPAALRWACIFCSVAGLARKPSVGCVFWGLPPLP